MVTENAEEPGKITVQLTEPIQRKVSALLQQRQQIDAQIQYTISTAVEALGHEGEMQVDLTTWVVTVTPKIAALPNRAERRRAKKGTTNDQEAQG